MRLLCFCCVIQLLSYCFLFPDKLNACQGFLMIIKIFLFGKKSVYLQCKKGTTKFNFNLTVNMTGCQ